MKSGIPLINKILVAVDFDHTLIDDNSDTYIQKLAPGGKFPPEMRERYSPGKCSVINTVFYSRNLRNFNQALGYSPDWKVCICRLFKYDLYSNQRMSEKEL